MKSLKLLLALVALPLALYIISPASAQDYTRPGVAVELEAVFHIQKPVDDSRWACVVNVPKKRMDCLPFHIIYEGIRRKQRKMGIFDIKMQEPAPPIKL